MIQVYIIKHLLSLYFEKYNNINKIRKSAGFGYRKLRDMRNGRVYNESYLRLFVAMAMPLTMEEFIEILIATARELYVFVEVHGEEYLEQARGRARR